jgi:hypothetical protein
MPQTSTLQTVIEAVEALSIDDQDFLFELIYKRRIAQYPITQRRQEIIKNATKTLEAIQNGTAQCGTVEDLIADIFGK